MSNLIRNWKESAQQANTSQDTVSEVAGKPKIKVSSRAVQVPVCINSRVTDSAGWLSNSISEYNEQLPVYAGRVPARVPEPSKGRRS